MQEAVGKKVEELLCARTSAVSLATCGRDGKIDVAPIGSAFWAGERTIGLLRGPLCRTYENLRENPEAVFMVANQSILRRLRFFFTGNMGTVGYRLHVRLREVRDLPAEEKERILRQRFGIFAGTKGGRRVAGVLRQLMLFEILQVRQIAPFGD